MILPDMECSQTSHTSLTEVRFWGNGRRDRHDGDAAAALERMHQAALAPDFTLKVSAK